MALRPGERVGAYEIVASLGRGGMGEVWRARDLTLRRDVALKVVTENLIQHPDSLARIEREAQLLASLNHPHIASIYGVEHTASGVALILELVDGPTLEDLIARGSLDVSEALRIARQMAAAVEAAHDQGIVHRDLKPANVKLTGGGQVKVLDFGLAKIADPSYVRQQDSSAAVTQAVLGTGTGIIVGTPAYMSPEQAKGQRVDRRCDIWAFGCILYELLTGHRAFAGGSVAEVMTAVLTAHADLTALPSDTPVSVSVLLRRCFERDPARRLRDIGEARVVLEQPETWATSPERPSVSHDRTWARRVGLAALAIGLLVGAAGTALMLARRSQTVAGAAMHVTLPLAPADRLSPSTPYMRPRTTAIGVSRDGRMVIFAGEVGTGAAAQTALYRRGLDEPLATRIIGTEGAIAGYLSPNAQSVAFLGGETTLRSVPVIGGAPVDITSLDLSSFGGGIAGGSWGEDGGLVLGGQVGPLRRVSATGGAVTALTTLPVAGGDYAHRLPQHLPNNRGILFTAVADPLGAGSRVFVLPPGAAAPRLLLQDAAEARYLPSGHLAFLRDGTLMVAPFDLETLQVTGGARPAVPGVMQALGSDDPWLDTGAGQYAVSDTGTLVYASGGVYPAMINRLLWLRRDGSTEAVGTPGRSLLGPRISPDGSSIVVAQVADPKKPLILYDMRRQIWTPLVGLTGGSIAFPVWTPDGEQVVFVAQGNIQVARVDGSAPVRQITGGTRPRVPSDISPDGRLLAFVELNTATTKSDIWVVPLDGSAAPRRTVQTPGDDVQPVFAPDGGWLAYASGDSGSMEVFVEAFPGPGPRVQVSSGGGVTPVWARDGQRLFYVKPGSVGMLMEVTVGRTAGLRAGTPRAITPFPYLVSGPARSYDVTADGQRFVVTTYEPAVATPVTELRMIVNWGAGVR